MPLLFETGTYRYTRPNVLVACSPGVQVWRGRALVACCSGMHATRLWQPLTLILHSRNQFAVCVWQE